MPDKNLTTISYAAGASLAAIALVYVFAPTFTIDESSTSSSRKKGIVGLRNAANDCFINSTLQALAGLGELRIYLIRETHRRKVDDDAVYSAQLIQPPHIDRPLPDWKIEGLQEGLVTQGLKDMLDSLNERPIYKKSISALKFVQCLEQAFRQRISRQQQDAQEFLQIVAERLKEEYHAGERARAHARLAASRATSEAALVNGDAVQQKLENLNLTNGHGEELPTPTTVPKIQTNGTQPAADEDEGFPMEGKYESQSECQTCGYKTKAREETFCMLTLNVPQVPSTTLSSCFDEIFKTEMIDDFKCERCRLIHGEAALKKDLEKAKNESEKTALEDAIRRLRHAIDVDPEQVPDDVLLPDISTAPKRKIARSTRLTSFPRILAVHLSRSIYDQTSTKNSAKVAFPERLPLGGLRDRRNYKLLGLVTHKGSHSSGHYESFRRQTTSAPYSNQNTFQPSGIYSKTASPAATPQPSTPQLDAIARGASPAGSTPDLLTSGSGSNSSTPSLSSSDASPKDRVRKRISPTSAPRDKQKESDSSSVRSVRSITASAKSTVSKISQRVNGNSTPGTSPPGSTPMAVAPRPPEHKRRKKAPVDRWWRISDEKVREAKTSEVLDLRREVYLLFYELERGENGSSP